MFDRISEAAEQVATRVSRRSCLGRLGRGAMTAAAALGGVLALPAISSAARKPAGPCGDHSWIGCMARNTGDHCITAEGRSGVCRYDKIDFTPPDACECYVKGPRNPRRA